MSRKACIIELVDPTIDERDSGAVLVPTILKINGEQVDWVAAENGFKIEGLSGGSDIVSVTITLFPSEFLIRGSFDGEELVQ